MTIIDPEAMPGRRGEGWVETTLADAHTATPAMSLRRVRLEAGGTGFDAIHGDGEAFVYVVSGTGTMEVNGETLPLAPETMVWLETGDHYRLIGGLHELEVLIATSGSKVSL